MSSLPYKRIDLNKLPPPDQENEVRTEGRAPEPVVPPSRVRSWIIPAALLLCCLQAGVYITIKNTQGIILTTTLIPVMGFGLLFALVILLNPLISLIGKRGRSRRLNRIELVCLFTSLLVTAGFSTFGPASHLIPLMTAPWNPEWNTPQRGWDEHLTNPEQPILGPRLYITDEEAVRTFREGVLVHPPVEGAPFGEYLAYYWEVAQAIPWSHWVQPLFLWIIFILACYGVFYSLSCLVLRYWSEREKLTFPLAQLPAAIMPDDHDRRLFPAIFYRPAFWMGFAISGFILSWNAAAAAGWLIPDFRITLGLGTNEFGQMVEGTPLEGLGGYFRALIVFTAIGLAFLLPTQVGSSIWGYTLFGQLLILLGIWLGFGETWADFPYDGRSTTNFLTAQGGGALLTFAGISLYRCLREYWYLARGRPAAESARLTLPVIWLGVSSAVIVLWMAFNQISLVWACAYVLFLCLVTVGVMRIVAETSMYWFVGSFGFFHLFSVLGLGKFVSGLVVAPLLPIYSIFFAGKETFVAPNVMNAAKIQKDANQGHRAFHVNLILCITVTVVFALVFTVFLAYMRGGQQMAGWFYAVANIDTVNATQALIEEGYDELTVNTAWFFFGAGWLLFTLWIRQRVFWFPHPIGLILLCVPILRLIWFSFFIGWVAKKITVRYGGKQTFDMVKLIFIGLIFGEIISVFAWGMMGLALDFHPGIGFHRYHP